MRSTAAGRRRFDFPAGLVAGLALIVLYGAGYAYARATHVLMHVVDYDSNCAMVPPSVRVSGHRIAFTDAAVPHAALALAFAPPMWLEGAAWSMAPMTFPSPTPGCE
jgi:hypothetical protein